MYHSYNSNQTNLIRSVNNTAPYSDPTTWDLHAALIATIINFEATEEYGDSPQRDRRFMIVFGSRDNAFVGKKQNKLIIFFASDYGTLTSEYDYNSNCGGYSYSSSAYSNANEFEEFRNKVDRYVPINPDNFAMGLRTYMSML